MSLLQELRALRESYVDAPPEPYVHQQETVYELHAKVVKACRRRAEAGCSTLSFHWDYVFTKDHEEWCNQHQVCTEVVEILRRQELTASCTEEFPEPCPNAYDEIEQPEGHHYIEVSWA
jgi:hypothetical protein